MVIGDTLHGLVDITKRHGKCLKVCLNMECTCEEEFLDRQHEQQKSVYQRDYLPQESLRDSSDQSAEETNTNTRPAIERV